MEELRSFKKFSPSTKQILIRFKEDGDRDALFENIKANVLTQNTIASKHTRQSAFRGILRNIFRMSDADMEPISFNSEQKQAYHDLNKESFQARHEDVIDRALFEAIVTSTDWAYLLCTSGLRISELHSAVEIKNNDVYATIAKKKDVVVEKIHILGDVDKWISKYNALDKGKEISATNMYVNRKLKSVIPDTFYKVSSHICRAIYARYVVTFKSNNGTQSNLIKKHLHHDSASVSAHYDHVRFGPDVIDIFESDTNESMYTEAELKAMTAAELSVLMSKHKVPGRSKMLNKKARIEALLLL